MRFRATLFVLALAGVLLAPSGALPARAADTLIAHVTGPTPVDVYGGRIVWSQREWPAGFFRLLESSGGVTHFVPVAPNPTPFDIDLGPSRRGGTIAVYSRCRRGALSPFDLDGRHGCDLYRFDFATRKEVVLRRANSRRADEYAPAVWKNRLAFARRYRSRRAGRVGVRLYWRHLTGRGASRRLRQGSARDGGVPSDLDVRGRRVPVFWSLDFGGYLRLLTTTGSFRRILTLPGRGAATLDYSVRGVSAVRGYVYWQLRAEEGEVWRWDPETGALSRATARLSPFTVGFAQDGDTSYYVRPVADAPCIYPACAVALYQIRRLDGLTFEPAPPLELK